MANFERIGYIYLLLGVFAAIISFVSVFIIILWIGEFDLLWPLRILYLYAWGLLLLFDIWSFIKFPSPFNYIALIIEAIPEGFLLFSVWEESIYFLLQTSEFVSLIEYSTTFKMIATFGLIVAVISLIFYMRHAIKNNY